MYFITGLCVQGWVVRCRAGLRIRTNDFCLLQRKKKCNRDLSFHFYDFLRILWRAWKDRHVYEGFQMVLALHPHAFVSFRSRAMKD